MKRKVKFLGMLALTIALVRFDSFAETLEGELPDITTHCPAFADIQNELSYTPEVDFSEAEITPFPFVLTCKYSKHFSGSQKVELYSANFPSEYIPGECYFNGMEGSKDKQKCQSKGDPKDCTVYCKKAKK